MEKELMLALKKLETLIKSNKIEEYEIKTFRLPKELKSEKINCFTIFLSDGGFVETLKVEDILKLEF